MGDTLKTISFIKWVRGTKPLEGMWTVCPKCGGKMDWVVLGGSEGSFWSCGDCNEEVYREQI